MMIRQRRIDEVTEEEPSSESQVASNDDDSSDEVIEVAKDEDSNTSGSDDGDATGSTGNDDTADEDDDEKEEDKNGDDANEGDDTQGDDDNENEPNVGVEENVGNDGGKEVVVTVEEKAVTDDKVNDDDEVEKDTKVDGYNKSEDDDFALDLVEEELQEYEELESEYGSSWGDDFLTETTVSETSFNDDQMDIEVVGSTANESFVAPSNDANDKDLNIISVPSSRSGSIYKNEHWNYLIAAALLVGGIYALSKFVAPTRATKFQRRRNMDHKRLPTIEDDDSSA